MRSCVLDASVAVKWYLDEPGSDAARALRGFEVGLIAPQLLQEDALLYREAFALATDSGRAVYDCLYLSLAMKKGCPFVTADRKLYNALQGTPLESHILWIDSIPVWMSRSTS